MAFDKEYFTPEQVDGQIEHLLQPQALHSSIDEAQLVDALQRSYHVPLVAEDHTSLARVRQRIKDELGSADILEHDPQFVNVREARSVTHPRRIGFVRLLSGLAAVLFIAALLGGWLVLTHLPHTLNAFTTVPQSDLYNIHSGIAYRIDGSTGKVVWQQPVPTRKQADPNHGGSAYLQVANAIVYAVLDFDIYALDARTGQQIWHVASQSSKEYFWFVVDNGRFYLFSLDNTFSALNAANGAELWHNTSFITENGYGFSVHNGNLYVQSSNFNVRDQKLYVLDGATGKMRWSYAMSGSLSDAPYIANGVVYFSSGDTLYAVKEQSGEKIWEKQFPATGNLANLYVVDGMLYVNGDSTIMEASTASRRIYALAAQTGQLLWTADAGYNAFNLPITHGQLLVWRQYNGLYSIASFDAHTGNMVWQVPFTCNARVSDPEAPQRTYPSCGAAWAQIINGAFYLLESDSQPRNGNQVSRMVYTLKSFDLGTGQLRSTHNLSVEQDNVGTIGASNGLLYIGEGVPRRGNTISYYDTIFVAYRLNTSAEMWRYTMPRFPAPKGANTSPNTSPPVLAP